MLLQPLNRVPPFRGFWRSYCVLVAEHACLVDGARQRPGFGPVYGHEAFPPLRVSGKFLMVASLGQHLQGGTLDPLIVCKLEVGRGNWPAVGAAYADKSVGLR
jgi:hypothetical protein